MQYRWILEKQELDVSAALFQAEEIPGIGPVSADPDPEAVRESMEQKGLFMETESGRRLEESYELAVLTVLSPEEYLVLSAPGREMELTNVYLRGETILVAVKDRDVTPYAFFWFPFIPMGIAAIYDMYRRCFDEAEDGGEILQFRMHEMDRPERIGSIRKSGEGCVFAEAGEAEIPVSDEEAFARIQHFLVYAHSRCMKRAMEEQPQKEETE